MLLIALIPFFANFHSASRGGQRFTRDWAADLLNSVEPYGILVTDGDNDTFPLWYAQDVEGIRKDVVVACSCLLETDWNVRDVIRRPIYPYDAAAGPAIYRNHTWVKPTGPPLHWTMDQADSVPGYFEVQKPMVFTKDSIVATIGRKDSISILSRGQLVILQFIKDAFPERPIYFSSRNTPDALGLGPHLLAQGLAQKLVMQIPKASRDTVSTPLGLTDVPRSLALWTTVYEGPAQLVREGQWVDRASAGIPYHYVLVGYYLANAVAQEGNRPVADQIMRTVELMARAAGLERGQQG
ncbi:MAG: hypothetical protein ACRENA_17260 [Vulcanimicrobiaceae bacterium]